MCQARQGEERAANSGTSSAWIRRHLSDSIYIWACGEKADDEDDEPQLSDGFIGWLILFMQGFAYTMLILLARVASSSDTGSSANDTEQSGYLLPSVTGAMYLLVASTTHDLCAGYSLLVDGPRTSHRVFGVGLLVVYGIMITAATTVLVSTSEDSASVVLNAVTVLFIADLDEKALKFLSAIPRKWRLFWAIESVAVSFALALIAIFCIGDDSQLLEGNNWVLQTWPSWYTWLLNPVCVTLSSYILSSALKSACEFYTAECLSVGESTFGDTVTRLLVRLLEVIKRVADCIRGEPCFYGTLAIWLVDAVVSWFFLNGRLGFPVAFYFHSTEAGNKDERIVLTEDKTILLYSNAVLVTGLAGKALGGVLRRTSDLGTDIAGPQSSSGVQEARQRWRSCADSRVPSLLVGWGIGYWVTSLIYVLVCSWDGGGCGWNDPPRFVTLVSYVVVPCFAVAGAFMVADTSILGPRLGDFVEPAVQRMSNRSRVEYWIMASVYRDSLIIWAAYCLDLTYDLDYYL